MPAAASTPAWRIPPPSILRSRRARSANSRGPQSSDPTGQPKPFERQKETESAGAASSAAASPVAASALKMRAPSRCTASPAPRATSAGEAVAAAVSAAPPQRFCVFSRQSRALRGAWMFGSRMAARTCAASMPPSGALGRGRSCTPPTRDAPAAS